MDTPWSHAGTHLLSRALYSSIILCVIAFSSVILLGVTQRYDDSGLRALLLPAPGCPAPCFLGIQLGVTPLAIAIKTLRASSLIQSVTNFSPGRYTLEFVEPLASMHTSEMPLL